MARIQDHKEYSLEALGGKDVMPVLLEGLSYLPNTWWISAGTLLGLERENGFIPNDTDLDIAIVGELEPNLPKHFEIIRTAWDEKERCHQHAYIHNPTNIIFDLFHWYKWDENRYYTESEKGKLFRDKSIIENITTKEYLGHTFRVPPDIDHYLTLWYGDWRTPRVGGKTQWV